MAFGEAAIRNAAKDNDTVARRATDFSVLSFGIKRFRTVSGEGASGCAPEQ
jgi:hypothetical protein